MAQIKQYKKDTILTPIFTALEVLFEVVIPLITAKIIDDGISAGNMSAVVKYGIIMIIVAFLSLESGVLAGKYAATASTGFATFVMLCMTTFSVSRSPTSINSARQDLSPV